MQFDLSPGQQVLWHYQHPSWQRSGLIKCRVLAIHRNTVKIAGRYRNGQWFERFTKRERLIFRG